MKILETLIREIRLLVSLEKVFLKKHCILRMRQREISTDEFKDAMSHAKIKKGARKKNLVSCPQNSSFQILLQEGKLREPRIKM